MFDKILIANRGEIALRILRAAKELGIATVAVHSTADADAMHVKLADESVCIGPPPARDSYLNIPALLSACEITGADAVHPGYGFLSENARFAEIVAEHGITFIGPKAEHIRMMGDKIEAKATARRLGIPCVPGSDGPHRRRERGARVAAEIGYPVLVKAASGGGGRGMKVARNEQRARHRHSPPRAPRPRPPSATTPSISRNISRSRAISKSRFSATARARPSISASATARCSAAIRRCWEESPSPALNDEQRAEIGEICAEAMRELQYAGAGTIEFLYENGAFYFIEMNTRIQVEHPVTETVTGVDLVSEQIRVAAGSPLSMRAGRHLVLGPRDRMPRQRRASVELSALARAASPIIIRRAASACASIPRPIRAIRSRRITIR